VGPRHSTEPGTDVVRQVVVVIEKACDWQHEGSAPVFAVALTSHMGSGLCLLMNSDIPD